MLPHTKVALVLTGSRQTSPQAQLPSARTSGRPQGNQRNLLQRFGLVPNHQTQSKGGPYTHKPPISNTPTTLNPHTQPPSPRDPRDPQPTSSGLVHLSVLLLLSHSASVGLLQFSRGATAPPSSTMAAAMEACSPGNR